MKKILCILFMLLLATPQTASAEWLGTWDKRVKIEIDNTNVDSALTDYPVLVHVSASCGINSEDISFVFDELTSDANSKKIAITEDDGTTEQYVEIEKWDDANEQAWLWTKVGTVASATVTTLYLYFDSAHVDNTEYVGDIGDTPGKAVWDDDFIAVYHMESASANVFPDSKQRTNDHVTTDGGTNNTTADGVIGKGADYAGAGISNLGNATDFDSLAKATISYIYYKRSQGGGNYGSLLGQSSGYNWGIRHHSTDYQSLRLNVNYRADTVSMVDDTWYYIAITYDDSANSSWAYNQGGLTDTDTSTTDTWLNPDHLISVGSNDARAIDGIIDEVRISDSNRGADWIKADYYVMVDEVNDFGAEETYVAPSDLVSYWITGVGNIAGNGNVRLAL